MALTLTQARSVYNRIGRTLDWQAFYEDAAADRLLANAALSTDQRIFEFGCGTGRLAARLLDSLPESTTYIGVDLSPVMVDLTTDRLTAWKQRAQAMLVDGSLPLPAADGSADRVLSTFVLDLLDLDYARTVLDDLHRILAPGGLLCLSSLTHGQGTLERAASHAWNGLWRVAPRLVGGCRPISISPLLGSEWTIRHHSTVHRWGLVTDVVIAARRR